MTDTKQCKWVVEFSCLEGSTSEVQQALPLHGDPWFLSLDYSGGTYPTIGYSDFETKTTGQDVFRSAKNLFNQINGSFFADGSPLQIRTVSVFQLREGQEPLRHQFIIGSLFQNRSIFGLGSIVLPTPTISGSGAVVDSLGSLKHEVPQSTFQQKAAYVGNNDNYLAEALREVSSERDWHTLYRAFECLKDSGFASGINSGNKSKVFKMTANSGGKRHAKHLNNDPDFVKKHGQMNIYEAQSFIQFWLKKAIDSAYEQLADNGVIPK